LNPPHLTQVSFGASALRGWISGRNRPPPERCGPKPWCKISLMAPKKKAKKKTAAKKVPTRSAAPKKISNKKSAQKKLTKKPAQKKSTTKKSAKKPKKSSPAKRAVTPISKRAVATVNTSTSKSQTGARRQPRDSAYPSNPKNTAPYADQDSDGLSDIEQADSESVSELIDEGNAFEAGAVSGVEQADNEDGREVHTREVPEDDVPEEYLDQD